MTQTHSRYRLMLATGGMILATLAAPAMAKDASGASPDKPTDAREAAAPQSASADGQADDGQANRKQSSDRLEDIVVTANKNGAQALQDVPASIQALSGEALKDAGVQQFSDYAYRVPSLTFQDLGPGDKNYIIRGINSTGAATVGVYYDETVISAQNSNDGSGHAPDIRLYDLDRIEVLKGPQGTLYGASSESGTIRIITNRPNSHEFGGYINGELSNTSKGGTNYKLNGAINLPIAEGKLAARFVGWYIDDSGYIDQPRIPAGRLNNVNTDETAGGRAELRYTPTSNLSLTALATYQKTHSDGSSRYTPEGTQSFSGPGIPPIPGGDLINTDVTRSPLDSKIQTYSLIGEYDFDAGSIVATTNYYKRDLLFRFDSTPVLINFGVPVRAVTTQPQPRHVWTNELRYSSDFDGPFNIVVGGFYSEEQKDFRVEVVKSDVFGNPAAPADPLDSGDALINPDGNTFLIRFDNRSRDQYALFSEATFDITPTLTAKGGLRYFHSSQNAVQSTVHPFGGFGPGRPGVQRNDSREHKVTYRANLSWQPNRDVLVYATAAEGFRVGGLNQADLPFASGIPRSYDSDSLWNYELGTKLTLLNGKLRFNAAVYHIDWSNIQVSALDDTKAFPFITNAGSADVNGVEATLDALLTRGVTLSVNGSYQDAFLTADQPGAGPGSPDLGRDGDNIPNVPHFTSSLNLDVDRPLTPDFNYIFHAAVNYHGSSHTTLGRDRDPFDVRLDSYTLANVNFGIKDEHWTARIFVRNLFDKRAMVDAIASVQDPLAYITVRPRTVGISLTRNF